ncbi:electron transfer flavoprotein subunit alpha/FixB family protein [Pseudaminobacter arsenicus]|uniref:Electron transfer flavoprotein subunit alpha/FixB family protein n=1 Tax=Borborobacter arsenicus TaxID=1851146 RepID=A0A432VBD8_9HYPH|nr:electron transfer flavoprotein subunit alpha/FixB family protein [Pseudaminobacter arsenicus]RUM99489.1 electron transfer flavoprotein subunit alpha/FixB family protein [Pseudaminobacter arsenicus]
MRALIFVEHSNGVVSENAFEMLLLAKSIGAECHGLICTGDAGAAQALGTQLTGFDAVSAVADPTVGHYNPEAVLIALKAAVETQAPDVVMTSYSTAGVDLAAGLAVRSERPMLGYVTDLELNSGGLSATSQVYGGKLTAKTDLPLPAVTTVMPGARKAGSLSGAAPAVTMLKPDLSGARTRVREIITPDNSSGVNLGNADMIFCVGRALGGTEKLPLAEALAAALKAELAGSRPVIDAGWLPKIRQVGKSGTKVKPKLYLMAGVSGAPEHLEGMESSELIIAINSDEQAPIFRKAHYGTACDMFQLIPALTERLNSGNS